MLTNIALRSAVRRQFPPASASASGIIIGIVPPPSASASSSSSSASSSPLRTSSMMFSSHAPLAATPRIMSPERHGTTIVCVRKNGRVCMMGDGMVSMGSVIVKPNAKKIRRIKSKVIKSSSSPPTPAADDGGAAAMAAASDDEGEAGGDDTIVGFAGATADAFTLLERLENKLDEHPGQLARSCVELAKGWRTDKYLRRLEASLLVADRTASFEITGNGDVLESHDGVLGVGSGSNFAMAAARALMDNPDLSAEDVARKAMKIGE